MSIIPTARHQLILKKGKIFRNVDGSSTDMGIGGGDLFPKNSSSWMDVYNRYIGKKIIEPYLCPGCNTVCPVDKLRGGHIVLGPQSDAGSAPSNIDLSGAGICFRPRRFIGGIPWSYTVSGQNLVTHSDRVFILPICEKCNRQKGSKEFKMFESKMLAHIICYGYTDDYRVYVPLYESDFFENYGIPSNTENFNRFSTVMSIKVKDTIDTWQGFYANLDDYDSRYLSSSAASLSSSVGMVTRSGFVYNAH
jgi:hypothetical protein